MFDSFAHYLSYGATDQQTARSLTDDYDGLLVPGTVAAFQSDGTKGFVLTLSASKRTRYVIDPRFPLFQQTLQRPKKSHESLAELLGDPTLVQRHDRPLSEHFDQDRAALIAQHWLRFNRGYTTLNSKHFDKYAKRLGEQIVPGDSQEPEYILVPYAMAESPTDPWWGVSERLWAAHEGEAASTGQSEKLVRVVAATSGGGLGGLLRQTDQTSVAIWANQLEELDTSPEGLNELSAYRDAIRGAAEDGKRLFALYGGFFSVLLRKFGLSGASHGIGYGEARNWVELPQTGPPPARYYVPKAHRYISQDLALLFWREAPELVRCHCVECGGRSPASLDYHALMRHSVRCRNSEIQTWNDFDVAQSAQQLIAASNEFEEELDWIDLPRNLRRQADNSYAHLKGWAEVLESGSS